jgi:hypothetical protein
LPGSPKTAPPAVASAPAAPPPPAKPQASASPLFREGQQVVVLADPAKPTGGVLLSADPEGSRGGPTVAPNTEVTVLDGELRNNAWFYTIRTPQGATGWISENRLKGAKP